MAPHVATHGRAGSFLGNGNAAIGHWLVTDVNRWP